MILASCLVRSAHLDIFWLLVFLIEGLYMRNALSTKVEILSQVYIKTVCNPIRVLKFDFPN